MANPPAIQKPTLLLDRQRALANIERMARKAARSRVRFRPHFKTHQSAAVGAWFRQVGVEAITVSSVTMARYFARHGWQDITIAFPANILEIEAINHLARQVELGLLVESADTVTFLARNLTGRANIWLKVDTGYGRTGLGWSEFEAIGQLAHQVEAAPNLSLRGLLTHSGHTYGARSQAEVETIYRDTVAKLEAARERLAAAGLGQIELSIGDTPACSLVEDLSGVDEIRPGNFIFFDLMQLQVGACREAEIAVALACPIVAKHPAQNKLVIYGGAVHLSKEAIRSAEGRPIYGYGAELGPNGWKPRLANVEVTALSQEHGLVEADAETVNRFKVGDLLAILPVHSCLTANLMGQYRTLNGETLRCMERS